MHNTKDDDVIVLMYVYIIPLVFLPQQFYLPLILMSPSSCETLLNLVPYYVLSCVSNKENGFHYHFFCNSSIIPTCCFNSFHNFSLSNRFLCLISIFSFIFHMFTFIYSYSKIFIHDFCLFSRGVCPLLYFNLRGKLIMSRIISSTLSH